MWPDTLVLLPLPWSKPADVSWVPPLCNWEQQIHGQTLFLLEKSRLQVLIRFSSHELEAQHMSKHQHFGHYLALILLSPPLCTKRCWQRAPAPRQPFLISEDGEKRDKDRKRDVHWRGGCPHSSCPVKSPQRKLIPALSHFSLVSAQLFTPIRQEKKTHSIARLFLLETSSSFTNANLCFTLLKTGLCSTNKGYRNSLLHCQNWRRLRFGVLVGDWVKSSHLIDPNVWKFLPNSANYFS